jgi:hypothetical protein
MTILERRGQFDTSPLFLLARLGLARAPHSWAIQGKAAKPIRISFALWKDADADPNSD